MTIRAHMYNFIRDNVYDGCRFSSFFQLVYEYINGVSEDEQTRTTKNEKKRLRAEIVSLKEKLTNGDMSPLDAIDDEQFVDLFQRFIYYHYRVM